MGYSIAGTRILELAMQLEVAGEAFYRNLEKQTNDIDISKVLLFFAEQEKEHYHTFKTLAEEAKKDTLKKEYSIDVEGIIKKSIEQFKKTGFGKGEDDKELDINKCLKIALNIEVETIRLFRVIQDSFEGQFEVLLFKIIHEEKKHAELIKNVMSRSKKKEWVSDEEIKAAREAEMEDARTVDDFVAENRRAVNSFDDYKYIVLIILFFVLIVMAMVGPTLIAKVIDLIWSN